MAYPNIYEREDGKFEITVLGVKYVGLNPEGAKLRYFFVKHNHSEGKHKEWCKYPCPMQKDIKNNLSKIKIICKKK